MTDRLTLRERWKNIKADWTQPRREIRHTAVGWRPAGYWQEECGETSASGEPEYFRVVRTGSKWKKEEQ